MAYTKHYDRIIPVDLDADVDVLRWLMRESFDTTAEKDCVRIVEYTEAQISPDDVSPRVAKELNRPLTDFAWWRFTAVASA